MNPKAVGDNIILEYTPPERWSGTGFLLPSEEEKRRHFRSKEKKEFTADDPPPDIMREGVIVSVGERVKKQGLVGKRTLFNRHDADLFELGDKKYYRINEKYVDNIFEGQSN